MKYVFNGHYRQFMGRLFAFGKPVEITDKATMIALDKDPEFRKVEEKVEAKVEQGPPQEVLPDECPKCGKVVKRGKFMHQKHCKGEK